MAQLFAAILIIGFAVFAFKVAILLLFLAGLIFRTKETIGLILILGAFALLSAYPVAGIAVIIVAAISAFVINGRRPRDPPSAADDPDQE